MSKRAHCLQEFAAHSSRVNCLKIGKKSGKVLVTGGDDKKVNMWAIGKATSIMSLEGHTSAVECVCFDTTEEIVVAGSSGGTVKLWDLDQQKVVRTLTGHKSNCQSVDFHPFGEFFASGSADTNLKVWDIRRKACIQTYKGHLKGINSIRFSPDGRWVVTGGEEGLVKLWDLTAGKPLRDLTGHTGSITGLEFHPHEFLLATASTDRTIKFWDLETFELVSTTDTYNSSSSGSSSGVLNTRAITYSNDGSALFCAEYDSLRVIGWEPVRTLDSVAVLWKDVVDLNISNDQIIAASISENMVSIHSVNINKLRPFSKEITSPSHTTTHDLRNSQNYHNFSQISFGDSNTTSSSNPTDSKVNNRKNSNTTLKDSNSSNNSNSNYNVNTKTNLSTSNENNNNNKYKSENQSSFESPVESRSVTHTKPTPQQSTPLNKRELQQQQQQQQFSINYSQNEPINQKSPTPGQFNINVGSSLELAEELLKSHNGIANVLTKRLSDLKIIRGLWSSGETKEALEAMISMNDIAITNDVLNILCDKQSLFTLDSCVTVLPAAGNLLSSPIEDYVMTGLRTIQILVTSFGPTIKSTLDAPPIKGVDLQRERRVEKCNLALISLKTIYSKLLSSIEKTKTHKVGHLMRSVSQMLKDVVDT